MLDHLARSATGRASTACVVVVRPPSLRRARGGARARPDRVGHRSSRRRRPGCSMRSCWRAPACASGAPARVWITWCDQVGVHPATVGTWLTRAVAAAGRRARHCRPSHGASRTSTSSATRTGASRVLQRREGDAMPAVGESDMGLFSLSRASLSRAPAASTPRPVDSAPARASAISCRSFRGSPQRRPWSTFPCTDDGGHRHQHAGRTARDRA